MSVAANSKVTTLDHLESIVLEGRRQGLRTVHCHGVFDLLHPGHIAHLKAARRLGDRLIVTLTPDRFVNKGPFRPVFRESLRLETLSALECVDHVALNDWPTAIETIRKIKPDIYVKGREYEEAGNDPTGNIALEEEAAKSVGAELVFTDGEVFSSSHLINHFLAPYPAEMEMFLKDFRKRHSADDVISEIKRLAELNVLVVGEAILDQYCYCTALGKSPKEAIVATKFLSEEQFAGGALATANHLAGFCGRVTLMTSIGSSEKDQAFIRSKLAPNVDWIPMVTADRPTVTKRRYVDPTYVSKMFEIQFLDDSPVSPELERRIIGALREQMGRHDLVVVNDFGHGLLTESVREFLCASAPFLALNTQTNSANMGFNPVTRYRRADYVCIDDPELRLAAGRPHGPVESIAPDIKRRLAASVLTVSLGSNGLVILNDCKSVDRVPVMTTRVIDRTGAGDALFAVTSPCVFRHMEPEMIGFIGNCVGALAVETVCNRDPVRPARLFPFIKALLK